MSYHFLLHIAIILLSTKLLGLLTRKVRMPQVVGALLAGLILGPAVLDLLSETEFVYNAAELGVIILMFCAGMETDITELKKTGKGSFIIALFGVIIPLAGGIGVALFFDKTGIFSDTSGSTFLQNLFIGIILTATSVSITVETLKELGKLKSKSGNAILGAAIIDDILGIIGLTIVTSIADTSVNVMIVLLKIFGFFLFAIIAGYAFYRVFKWLSAKRSKLHRYVILAFVFCLLMAYIAEEGFGVADITGAFIAGLIISCTPKSEYILTKLDVLSYAMFSPIFFASIGLRVQLPKMSVEIIAFAVTLTIVAILTKIIGCGLGAKLCHFNNRRSLRIGVGMVSRGEVALIIASKGSALGLLGDNILGPIIIMVVVTTIITPILLKIVFRDVVEEEKEEEIVMHKRLRVDKIKDHELLLSHMIHDMVHDMLHNGKDEKEIVNTIHDEMKNKK